MSKMNVTFILQSNDVGPKILTPLSDNPLSFNSGISLFSVLAQNGTEVN
jgi:hypothetical protein